MKGSKTFLLLLVVLGLGGYIWFYEIHQLSTAQKAALERQAFDVQVELVEGVGIRTPDYEIEVFKTDQGWELRHPQGARAALPMVQQLLARLKTLDKGELITPADMRAKDQSLAEYGLAVPRIQLTLKSRGKTRVFDVGDKNPLGNSLYVKEQETHNVMMVSTDLLEVLPEDPLAFRDKILFPLHEEEVQALDLLSNQQTLRLEKRDGIWVMTAPVSAEADQEQVAILLNKLLQARIDGVVNEPQKEDLDQFAASGNEQVVRLWSANSKVPAEVVLGGDLPLSPDHLLARIMGQEGLVHVSKGMRALALSPVALFRDRKLFEVDPGLVDEIVIERAGKTLHLQKNTEEWRVVDPVNMKASTERVQNMMQHWLNARVEHFVPRDNPPSPVGMTVRFRSGEKEEMFELLEQDVAPGRAWLRKQGNTLEKMVVVPDLMTFAPVEVTPYLSREVLQFDPAQVVRLSVSSGEQTRVFVRSGPGEPWSSQLPEETVDETWINETLATFANLTALDLETLNPQHPADYGLDQPDLRFSVGLAGDEAGNRTLLVGKLRQEGGRYAVVQGQPLLFLLSDEQVAPLINLPEAAE